MKKIISFLFSFLLFVNTAFAFPNEPEGFRELKWGDSIELFFNSYSNAKLKESIKAKDEKTGKTVILSTYMANLQNNLLSDLVLRDKALFLFTDQKFSGVILLSIPIESGYPFIEEKGNFLEKLVSLYGQPTHKEIDNDTNMSKKYTDYLWNSDKKSVIMVFTETSNIPKRDSHIAVSIFSRKDIDLIFKNRLNKNENPKNQGW